MVVGKGLAGLEAGESYRLNGQYVNHPKYGRQFDVADALVDAPSEAAGVAKFLQKHFKGCGEKTAGVILDWYASQGGGLERLRSELVNKPWEVERCPALGARKIEYLDASGAGLDVHVARRLSAGLVAARVPDQVLKRLASWLLKSSGQHSSVPVEACWGSIQSDPFMPVLHVDGYGMGIAEKVASALGIPKDHPTRIACLTHYAITEALRRHGHTFLTMAQARRALAEEGCRDSVETCVSFAKARGFPLEIHESRVYTTALRRAETQVVNYLGLMLKPSTPIWARPVEELEAAIDRLEAQRHDGFRLDDGQRTALVEMLTAKVRLHSLTSWPGCGKTAFLEIVAGLVKDVVFAAPYSKAAKVLNARIQKYGVGACTAHMLLEATGEGFRRNRKNPLIACAVVLDETGTVDIFLLASLLEAMSPWAHLIAVGDVDQLESVGQGQVLQDIVDIERADHHRLTTTYRNSGAILDLVGMIRQGIYPKDTPGDEVVFLGDGKGEEFGFDDLIKLWMECVSRESFESVGLLFGHRQGDRRVQGWNVTYINGLIQQLVNKATGSNVLPGTEVRINDRVIVRKPMALKRTNADGEEEIIGHIANGDTGYVMGFSVGAKGALESVRIKLDEGRTIDFPGFAISKLELAYALTVHQAQGSEFAEVILVIPGGASGFMNRNLLLTGASRAQKKLWMVGKQSDIEQVAARERPRRNSAVALLVNNLLNG
ncbi:AAA family ATPase [Ottowia sp.]|uniref:ATP-dependent DNA helicase n=1 Tax=Ottowia sp. TaxID=1898956 RepID=UPI0025FA5FB4|nr:AAA family ATPase [Ottowia sp.]MBK6616120.1 AAA family ATPase [Ottowia sp.]